MKTENRNASGFSSAETHPEHGTAENRERMRKVLIVEEDMATRDVLHGLFEGGSGFGICVEIRNGAEAIAATEEVLPRLTILGLSNGRG
jgi:hypothetical protein